MKYWCAQISNFEEKKLFVGSQEQEAGRSAVPGEAYGEHLIGRKERIKHWRSIRVESVLSNMS
jgi:hypothetical protein